MLLFRKIKSGKPFQSSTFRDEIDKATKIIGADILDDFKRTVKTWKHKVAFKLKIERGGSSGGVKIGVTTTDPIYGYVDLGTRPHIIKAKRAPMLRFKLGGRPKTAPNEILSTPGAPGTIPMSKKQVHHPGNKPRNFTKIIAKSYQKELNRVVKNALERAARR